MKMEPKKTRPTNQGRNLKAKTAKTRVHCRVDAYDATTRERISEMDNRVLETDMKSFIHLHVKDMFITMPFNDRNLRIAIFVATKRRKA